MKKELTPNGARMESQVVPPIVSIVIPVKNERDRVDECVRRVAASTYPAERMEILVCDGMSEDGTRGQVLDLAREHEESHGLRVRLIENLPGHRTSGLNAGIKAARGEIVVRVDARTHVAPDYIERCVQTLLRTGADNVGGVTEPVTTTATQTAIGIAMSHKLGVGDARFRVGGESGPVESVYPGCFRRSVFEKVGLFDVDAPIMSEDSDINQRIRDAGGTVYLDTGIAVGYEPRETFRSLWKLYFRYGGARAGFVLKHRRFTSWRQLVPPGFVAALAMLTALSWVGPPVRWALAILAGTYVAALAGASVRVATSRGQAGLLWRVPLAIACIHFAWALGFMRRFAQRAGLGAHWSD